MKSTLNTGLLVAALILGLCASAPAQAQQAAYVSLEGTKFVLVLPKELATIPKGGHILLTARAGKKQEVAAKKITTLSTWGGIPAVILDIPAGKQITELCFSISKKVPVQMDYGVDGKSKTGCLEVARFAPGGTVLGLDANAFSFSGYAKMIM